MPRHQEPVLFEQMFGKRWPVVAWRAAAIFVVGYVALPLLFGHNRLGGAIQFFATLFSFVFTAVALYEFAQAREAASEKLSDDNIINDQIPVEPAQWSIELLKQIEWKHLLELCVAIYQEKGFHCETSSLDADGNVTVWLHQGGSEQPTAIARSRAWGDLSVDAEAVQALMEVMATGRIAKAFFITSGDFSAEARALAQGSHVILIDGKLLLAMLNRLSSETRERLLNIVAAGDFTTPSCPGCGLKMIVSDNDHGPLWGCRTFPRCKQTLAMRHVAA